MSQPNPLEQQVEHTQQQKAVAISQFAQLEQITGIRLNLTGPEMRRALDDATRKVFIRGPSNDTIRARVTTTFVSELRKRGEKGDERALEMAARIERAREAKDNPAPLKKPEAPAVKVSAPRPLDAQAEKAIRSLADMYGVDPKYLLNEVRTAQVRVSRDSAGNTSMAVQNSYVDPQAKDQHMKSVANDLAANILFAAYGSGKPYTGGKPNFSEDNVVDGAGRYSLVNTTSVVGDRTTNKWLDGEAKRLKVDRTVLENTLTTYATMQAADPALAERYLGHSGLTPEAMNVVRIAGPKMSSELKPDGQTRMYVTLQDTFSIRNEIARDERLKRTV